MFIIYMFIYKHIIYMDKKDAPVPEIILRFRGD